MAIVSATDDRETMLDDDEGIAPVIDDRSVRNTGKAIAAFRTISEVSTDLDVPQHVLRFWETKFTQLRPLKRGGGRRYYRPEDVALLRRIHGLLYKDGYTIKGVQRVLRTPRCVADRDVSSDDQQFTIADSAPVVSVEPDKNENASILHEILADLRNLRALLD